MDFDSEYPARCAELARRFYRDDKLNCSEASFRAIMEGTGDPCPPELVRAATGFGGGIGRSGCACGILTGSIIAAGMLFGRTEETGRPPKRCMALSHRIHDAFKELNGATCCRVLHRGLTMDTPEQRAACAERTGTSVEAIARLIMEEYLKDRPAD